MEDLFKRLSHPDIAYGPVPFWFLNDHLSRAEIHDQLIDFHDHGVPGVVIHPRMGFDATVPYLSDRYMDWMAYICETARTLGMFVFLYDEGMYPSGSACGQVVRENPAFAARGLEMTETRNPDGNPVALLALPVDKDGRPDADRARSVLSPDDVKTDEVLRYVTCVFSHGNIRGLHPDEDDGGEHAPAAADLLNPDAVNCFIRLTHERYYARLSAFFGSTIRAMFTDEPNPLGRNPLPGLVSWTDGLEQEWLKDRPLSDLALLFLDGIRAPEVRAYHEQLVRNRMIQTFYRPLQTWCESHRIALTGHPAWPDAMDLEDCFSLPGQDLVWGWVRPGKTSLTGRESCLAQCAADAALFAGKPESLCECFGCCGPEGSQWGMTVTHMKWMADWLFVRGISRLVPHAFFYSLRLKEARDDRPPDAGPNNYFWSYYRDFSDYVARMGMLLYGRRSLARVAILTNGREMDDSISSALYVHQIPFHFVTVQALLEGECTEKGLRLPCQTVTCLLLPSSLKLPDTLLNRLEGMDRFRILSTREAGWIEQLTQDTQLQPMTFDQAPNFRVQWFEKEGTSYVLLTNEGEEPCHTAFTLPFRQTVKCLNPWTGETRNLGKLRSGKITLEAADSVVMQFTPGGTSKEPKADCGWQTIDLSDQVQFEDARLQALSALGNWQDKEGLSDYSGSLTYKLSLPAHLPSGPVVLSLGDVREMVVIQEPQSGREAHLLMGPWEVDISGLLNRQTSSADRPESTEASESSVIPDVAVQEGNGMTELLLTVTSSRVTEMDCKPWPCGLFGPVLLRIPSDQSI